MKVLRIKSKERIIYEVDDSNFHPQQVLDQFEESVRKIGEHFSDWSGNPYQSVHSTALYDIIVNEEKRENGLKQGLSNSSVSAVKAIWLLAPMKVLNIGSTIRTRVLFRLVGQTPEI